MIPTASWPLSYRFIGDRPGLTDEFSSLFSSCGFLPAGGDRECLTVIFLPELDDVRSDSDYQPIVEWRGLSVIAKADEIFFTYRAWDLHVDLSTLTFRCAGPDPNADERLNFREFFLLSPLLFILHRLGFFELHAASCACEEAGYLFLGPSGSGKTTAMLSLIEAGWNYLSDDATVVSSGPGSGLLARALRKSFSLKPDHLTRHPQLGGYTMETVPASDKLRINPREVWPGQYTAACSPRFIVVCKTADQETSEIRAMSRAESLARLVGSTPWLMFDRTTAAAHLETFRSLAATCHGFELTAGRELIRNTDRLSSLIAPERLYRNRFRLDEDERWD